MNRPGCITALLAVCCAVSVLKWHAVIERFNTPQQYLKQIKPSHLLHIWKLRFFSAGWPPPPPHHAREWPPPVFSYHSLFAFNNFLFISDIINCPILCICHNNNYNTLWFHQCRYTLIENFIRYSLNIFFRLIDLLDLTFPLGGLTSCVFRDALLHTTVVMCDYLHYCHLPVSFVQSGSSPLTSLIDNTVLTAELLLVGCFKKNFSANRMICIF